jgi:hypothetical protein
VAGGGAPMTIVRVDGEGQWRVVHVTTGRAHGGRASASGGGVWRSGDSGRWGGEGQRWAVRWRGVAMHIDLANVDWRERQWRGGLGEKGCLRLDTIFG